MRKNLFLLTLLFLCATFLVGVNTSQATENSSAMSFTEETLTVKAGDSFELFLTGESANAVDWTVSDPSIIMITDSNTRRGWFEAIGSGEAYVYARAQDGSEASCLINISPTKIELPSDGIDIGFYSKDLYICSDYELSWESSNNDIVTVSKIDRGSYDDDDNYDPRRNKVTIKGKGLGTAVLTFSDNYGTSVEYTVNVQNTYFEFSKKNVVIDLSDYDYEDYYDDYSEYVDVYGDKIDSVSSSDKTVVVASIEDYDYDYDNDYDYDYDYTYRTTISLTGKKPGKAVITVTDENGHQDTFNVTVKSTFKLSSYSLTVDTPSVSYDEDARCLAWGYITNYKATWVDTWAKTGHIKSVTSSNTNVVKIKKVSDIYGDSDYYWCIIPVGVGTANLVCKDTYGQSKTCTIKVKNAYVSKYIKYYSKLNNLAYGNKSITGKTLKKAKVTVTIAGKKYTATANNAGKFKVKVPVKKIGTKIKYTVKYNKGSYSVTKKIVKPKTTVSMSTIYRNSKKVTITVKNAHKGDIVTLKIGSKTYKKKIKKDSKKYKYTVKVTKKKKAGSKAKVQVKNKFKQSLTTKKAVIYYASSIKKGMTKKQCKLVPGWGSPDEVNYSSGITTWWYDDDGDGYAVDSYLMFYKGKLTDWYY